MRGASSGGNLLTVVGFQMLIGSAALWIPALLLETWQVNWSPLVIGAFFYTIFVPGILATFLGAAVSGVAPAAQPPWGAPG